MIQWFKRLICKYKGHDFAIYEFRTGYWGNDIEMAGECKRCGYDTHEGLEEYKY